MLGAAFFKFFKLQLFDDPRCSGVRAFRVESDPGRIGYAVNTVEARDDGRGLSGCGFAHRVDADLASGIDVKARIQDGDGVTTQMSAVKNPAVFAFGLADRDADIHVVSSFFAARTEQARMGNRSIEAVVPRGSRRSEEFHLRSVEAAFANGAMG